MEGINWIELTKNVYVLVGVLASVLVFREIFKLIRPILERKLNGGKTPPIELPCVKEGRCVPADVAVRKMAEQVKDLHDWHSVTDEEGVKIWYVRRSFYETLERLHATEEKIAGILQELVRSNTNVERALDRVEQKIDNHQRSQP